MNYGPKLGELNGIEYYDFPPPGKLAAAGVEQKLRDLGFGYRAKYIATTARVIAHEKSLEWLHGLRKEPYKVAHEALLELSGVGPKVADCVCLMSMDKAEAVPVDTHGGLMQASFLDCLLTCLSFANRYTGLQVW